MLYNTVETSDSMCFISNIDRKKTISEQEWAFNKHPLTKQISKKKMIQEMVLFLLYFVNSSILRYSLT